MGFVVKRRMFFLLGFILCMSKLVAMSDGEGVCPICGQPNFESKFSLFDIFSGDKISVDGLENAHVECLREQGFVQEAPNTEIAYDDIRALHSILLNEVLYRILRKMCNCGDCQQMRDCLRNCIDVFFYRNRFLVLVPLALAPLALVPVVMSDKAKSLGAKVKEYLAGIFGPPTSDM